jgi:hypothetical protein
MIVRVDLVLERVEPIALRHILGVVRGQVQDCPGTFYPLPIALPNARFEAEAVRVLALVLMGCGVPYRQC